MLAQKTRSRRTRSGVTFPGMDPVPNPAVKAFSDSIGDGRALVEVWIRPEGGGFELRHRADLDLDEAALELVRPDDLRRISRTTGGGVFRPNKAAPGLRRGWRCRAASPVELGMALDQLYPGGIPDWYAVQQGNPAVTHFQEFTARQTGLYRVTGLLSGEPASRMIRACCAARFCLRQRLWSAPGAGPDAAAGKSDLPCLEPCALLLDLARRAMKREQEEKVTVPLAASDLEVVIAGLRRALDAGNPAGREGNTMDPANPRRRQLLLELLQSHLPSDPAAGPATE